MLYLYDVTPHLVAHFIRIRRVHCKSKAEGYIDNSNWLNWFVTLRIHHFAQIWTITYENRILQVSLYKPFFLASRSFALTGTFSTSRHPAFFDRVSNHDG